MDKPYVVGMDIGGTNSVFGIVDARGNILSVDSIKTQAYKEFGDYVAAVAEKLLPMIEAVGGTNKIKGMGIGAPNGNYHSGNIEHSANLPWKGIVPLAEEFKKTIPERGYKIYLKLASFNLGDITVYGEDINYLVEYIHRA